ncbi:hypothetical protein Tco_0311016 [Tanacetum coccineum]
MLPSLKAVGICFRLRDISESRNPFVEYAVQHTIAAAYVTLDKIQFIMGWYSWKLNIIMTGIDDKRPQRKHIQDANDNRLHEIPFLRCSEKKMVWIL